MSAVLAKTAGHVGAALRPAAVSAKRKRIALALAGIADLVQMGYFPFFGEGVLSLPDDALDAIVALVLLAVLAFRVSPRERAPLGRLVFALAMELVPGATLFPTWTAVVLSMPTLPEPAPLAPAVRT